MNSSRKRLKVAYIALVCAMPWPSAVAATRGAAGDARAALALLSMSDQSAMAATPPADRKSPAKSGQNTAGGASSFCASRAAAAAPHLPLRLEEQVQTAQHTRSSCATLCRFLV